MDNDQSANAHLHIFVSGRVQGVGFRMFAYDAAHRLNLVGWVRNRFDGDVEIVAEGPRQNLEILLGIVRQGPSVSLVTDVKFNWDEPTGSYSRFELRMTQ
jgi:acylphosphatase